MAETKTKPTGESVDAYLASRGSPEQMALLADLDLKVLEALIAASDAELERRYPMHTK